MSVQFTTQQKNAIEGKGDALLVSAAAGSGKTAVLVERVLRYLAEQGGDIRRLMIMTYTTAAAEEMRQKIKRKVNEALQQSGGDHLMRQSAMIDSAEIGTVHSVCLGLITRYFDRLDLDPRMRLIGDADEEAMIAEETEKLLEELFGRKEERFAYFLQCYGGGRNDKKLSELLIRGMKFLENQPFPDQFVYKALAPYRKRKDDLFYRFIEDGLYQYLSEGLEALRIRYLFMLQKFQQWGMERCEPLTLFLTAEQQEVERISALPSLHNYAEFSKQVRNFKFATAQWRIWNKEGVIAEEVLEQIKQERERFKKAFNDFIVPFAAEESEEVERLDEQGKRIRAFLELSLELKERLEKERRKRGVISFHDMEQMALTLLVERYDAETDTLVPTELALQLREDYDEIIVDEFQDTNRVQDLIFRALSKEGKNLFMVGDLKQSIYRFRGAEPEIFDQKRKVSVPFEQEKLTAPTVLELNKNFRSHAGILRFANATFGALMSEQMGGVTYDEREQLNCGREYAAPEQCRAELHWIAPQPEDASGKKVKPAEQNARYTAALIKRMVEQREELLLPDGAKRPVEYRDFAILLRNATGAASLYENVLAAEGIPSTNQSDGMRFFELPEVQSILSYLLVLNNPYDDVAMVSLLMGDYFRFSVGELAALRNRKQPLFDNLRHAATTDAKAKKVLDTIQEYRSLAGTLYVYDLLHRIYQQSGVFATYAAEGEAEKCANLELLAEDARSFEQEGYRGLYAFVQHIRISKNSTQGGARLRAETNSVQIMTIHKSKGLEFPICILADGEKRFNRADTKEAVLLHSRYGAAAEEMDLPSFYKGRSVSQRVLADQIITDSVSEEERVLYVALTRPESKVIILANVEQETLQQWATEGALLGRPLPRWLLTDHSSCYVRWLITLLAGSEEGAPLRRKFDLQEGDYPPLYLKWVEAETEQEAPRQQEQPRQAPAFDLEAFRKRMNWAYPHAEAVRMPAKLSVSELKGLREPEEDAQPLLEERAKLSKPRFANAFAPRGNEIGNAMHQALQFCDFERLQKDVAAELDRLVTLKFITAEQRKMIAEEKLYRFTQSDCFKDLLSADYYCKEERFLFPMNGAELFRGGEGEVLIQGVLDCYSVRGDTATILDYKTDRVESQEELIRRYQVQMDLYAEALKRVKGLKVQKKIIYSFALEKEILV